MNTDSVLSIEHNQNTSDIHLAAGTAFLSVTGDLSCPHRLLLTDHISQVKCLQEPGVQVEEPGVCLHAPGC